MTLSTLKLTESPPFRTYPEFRPSSSFRSRASVFSSASFATNAGRRPVSLVSASVTLPVEPVELSPWSSNGTPAFVDLTKRYAFEFAESACTLAATKA